MFESYGNSIPTSKFKGAAHSIDDFDLKRSLVQPQVFTGFSLETKLKNNSPYLEETPYFVEFCDIPL
jgi:hypothetical protein